MQSKIILSPPCLHLCLQRVSHELIVVPGPKLQAELNHVYSSRAGGAVAGEDS